MGYIMKIPSSSFCNLNNFHEEYDCLFDIYHSKISTVKSKRELLLFINDRFKFSNRY